MHLEKGKPLQQIVPYQAYDLLSPCCAGFDVGTDEDIVISRLEVLYYFVHLVFLYQYKNGSPNRTWNIISRTTTSMASTVLDTR